MLLTAPLLTKSSFFGSLLHKFRQVKITKSQKPSTKTTNNTIKNTNNNNNNFTPITNAADAIAPPANNLNKNLLKTNQIDASRPVLLNANAKSESFSTTAATFKTNEEKIGLPPRPKRPITPYFRYMRDMRPKLLAENPNLKTQDMVKQLSKQWATVDVKIKERLQNEFKRDQQVYVEQRAKYDAKVTPEQRAELIQLKREKQAADERRKLRRRFRELGRPKRPASAFFRFVQQERSSQLPNQTYRDWHAKCTQKWSRLTDAEKESYMKESKDEMENYKKQLYAWEEKMLRMGNTDVVRAGHLIDPPEPKPRKSERQN